MLLGVPSSCTVHFMKWSDWLFNGQRVYKYFKIAFNWKASNWKKKFIKWIHINHHLSTHNVSSVRLWMCSLYCKQCMRNVVWVQFQPHNEIWLKSSEETTEHGNNLHVIQKIKCTIILCSGCGRHVFVHCQSYAYECLSVELCNVQFVVLKFNVFTECSTAAAAATDDDVVGAC